MEREGKRSSTIKRYNSYPCFFLSAYTIAKYGMSMCVLGMAEEYKANGIAVNALWPRTGMVCMYRAL